MSLKQDREEMMETKSQHTENRIKDEQNRNCSNICCYLVTQHFSIRLQYSQVRQTKFAQSGNDRIEKNKKRLFS